MDTSTYILANVRRLMFLLYFLGLGPSYVKNTVGRLNMTTIGGCTGFEGDYNWTYHKNSCLNISKQTLKSFPYRTDIQPNWSSALWISSHITQLLSRMSREHEISLGPPACRWSTLVYNFSAWRSWKRYARMLVERRRLLQLHYSLLPASRTRKCAANGRSIVTLLTEERLGLNWKKTLEYLLN